MKRLNFHTFCQSISKVLSNDYLSTSLILLAIVAILFASNVLSRVDNLVYDVGQKLQQKPAPADVVIVAIDEESLSQLGRWPWPRKIHTQLIDQLNQAGAAAIGMDIIFAEPDKDVAADEALADAMRRSNKVVLPVLMEETREKGQLLESLPLPALASAAADLGRVHAVLDEDGIARSVYLFEGLGAPVWQHFSQAILNVASGKLSQNNFAKSASNNAEMFTLARAQHKKISFLGPPGHFSTISYVQVINGQFEKDFFKNKIVLVGATASGMNDLLPTPVSSLGQPMSGVEVHANVLQSIRKNTLINADPPKLAWLILAIAALLPLLWIPKVSALKGLTFTLVYFALMVLLAAILPKVLGVWVAPSAALLAILLAYPVWSWRKLEAAQKYLDYELTYLQQHIDLPKHNIASLLANYDVFDARIAKVRAATEQLRHLQESRKETLAFISHDLRAPLARALMIAESHEVIKEKLHAPLSQAIELAEDFLQTSRAEMLDETNFKELDFVDLTHQAVDEAYESAAKKNITLERLIKDGQIWMHGNFGLLERAILNLLLNAVKFSPENATVTTQLSVVNQQAVVTITNAGAGIAEEEQAHLFKRFNRLKSGQTGIAGAGLGLYFVQTVAEKHHGSVAVESVLGQSTSFSLSLPIVS